MSESNRYERGAEMMKKVYGDLVPAAPEGARTSRMSPTLMWSWKKFEDKPGGASGWSLGAGTRLIETR